MKQGEARMLMRNARIGLCAGFTAVLVSGCGASTTRLDEALLIDGDGIKVKVVRYFEHLPLSFSGEVAIVQCASGATRNRPEGKTNDPGWVIVDRFVALGTRDAKEVLDKARKHVLLNRGKALVWNHGWVLSVTFDGCGRFTSWDARTLPPQMTIPAQFPDYCKPKGMVDCSREDFRFIGDRVPVFSALQASPSGDVSFEVRSAAFRGGGPIRVRSRDFGQTWKIEQDDGFSKE